MIFIRMATAEDLPQLAGLFNLYRIFYGKLSDPEGAFQFLSERINLKDSVIYVAEEEGELLGFTQLYPVYSSTRMKKSWILNDLYVEKAHRERGISKQLIGMAKNLAVNSHAAGLLLETQKTNEIGNSLYPSVGFSPYDLTNFYWWEPEGISL